MSMQEKKFYFFIGTTAELIKIAPVINALERRNIAYTLITSGQNKIRLEDLQGFINKEKADIAFLEKKDKSSLYHFAFWAIRAFITGLIVLRRACKDIDKKNTYFIIHGDTVSSSIGAILAKLLGLPLVLIECGDLSFHILEPFPEEICRNINIRLADILFPPNAWAASNVQFVKGTVIDTKYNTLVESFLWAMNTKVKNKKIQSFKKYYILSLHRQEHVIFGKEWSKEMIVFVMNNADPSLQCLIINHPLTVGIINSLGYHPDTKNKRIQVLPHLPYTDFMKLMNNAAFIATDSAFNQLESCLLGLPYLGLRHYTEQIEGLNENVVISKGDKKIMRQFLTNYQQYRTKPITLKTKPSKIIVDYLLHS